MDLVQNLNAVKAGAAIPLNQTTYKGFRKLTFRVFTCY